MGSLSSFSYFEEQERRRFQASLDLTASPTVKRDTQIANEHLCIMKGYQRPYRNDPFIMLAPNANKWAGGETIWQHSSTYDTALSVSLVIQYTKERKR